MATETRVVERESRTILKPARSPLDQLNPRSTHPATHPSPPDDDDDERGSEENCDDDCDDDVADGYDVIYHVTRLHFRSLGIS